MTKLFRLLTLLTLSFVLLLGCKKKVNISETVLSVKEIKDIGQLISAEYSGEVVSSLSLEENTEVEAEMQTRFDSLVKKKVEVVQYFTSKHQKKLEKLNQDVIKRFNRLEKRDKEDVKLFKSSEDSLHFKIVRLKELKAIDQRKENQLLKRFNRLTRKTANEKAKILRKSLKTSEKESLKVLQKASSLSKNNLIEQLKTGGYQKFKEDNAKKIDRYKKKAKKKGRRQLENEIGVKHARRKDKKKEIGHFSTLMANVKQKVPLPMISKQGYGITITAMA